jgi:mercuric ion transport protein
MTQLTPVPTPSVEPAAPTSTADPTAEASAAGVPADDAARTERRGRWWIFGSFVLCPCHLPLTLAVLATVFGGTVLGALLRDHALVAGLVITAAWVAGTARGFWLVRMAQRGACPLPRRPA